MTSQWFDRTFQFDLPEWLFPVMVERVRGTPARIDEKVRDLSPVAMTSREGDRWSIQEHIGHLIDLDDVHDGRLDDYLASATVLRAADRENRRTHEAKHNERPLRELLAEFRDRRSRFVERLDTWEVQRWSQTAIHPRLSQPMRVIDLVQFVADHDDHHLTRMTELARHFARV